MPDQLHALHGRVLLLLLMSGIPVFELDEQCDESSVFVLRLNSEASIETIVMMRGAWADAWGKAGRLPPVLMIFDPETQLSALTGEQLREAGLMRMRLDS